MIVKFNEAQHIAKRQLELLVDEQLDSKQESQLISHIDHCKECQSQLERLVENGNDWSSIHQHLIDVDVLETPDESSIRKLLDLLGPTDHPEMLGRLGQYEVSAVIGTGSTGIVVKAFERQLNRFVAIKVLHPKLCDSGAARKRFDREGRAIAAVVNPHVVPVFAISEHLGHPFIVMQYMPGGSLQQRIARDGQLSSEEVVRLGLHIAEGLEAAHAQGIVHRDVKPANVMLEAGLDRAMVSDFGLARVNNEAAMTCSGLITGTPQYMSPEQARGETLDGRSDLFSLGSTLYAACTGHSPFRAANVFGVIKRVCDEQPRGIHEYNPQAPAWLADFIEVLMKKKKEERFQSAAEIRHCLSAEIAHMQAPNTVAQPARPWQGSVHETKRRTRVLWAALVVAFAILAGWLVANPFSGMAPQSESEAQSNGASQDDDLTKAITRLVVHEGAPLRAFDFVKEHSFPVLADGSLLLRSEIGNIEVETHDELRVDIKAVISIAAANRKQAEALLRKHDFIKDIKGNDLVEGRDACLTSEWGFVEADVNRFSAETIKRYSSNNNQLSISRILGNNDQSYISFRIKVPRRFNVEVFNADGNITLPNINGKIKTVVNDGNITIGNTDGDLDIYLEDGFLLAGDVTGDVTFKGEDGDVTLGDIGGAVNISTEDAKIEIKKAKEFATVKLEDGEIKFGIASKGARLEIVQDGDIHLTELAGKIQASTDEGKITVERLGQIDTDSSITTMEGAIRIGVVVQTSIDIEAKSEKGKVRGSLVTEPKANVADIELHGGGPTLSLQNKRGAIQLDEIN